MKKALVIGAAGQIGRPAVRALAEDGWEVTAASLGGGRDAHWPDAVRTVRLDREDGDAVAALVGDGVDLVVDLVAFTPEHGQQLAGLTDRIGSAVVVSSGAVYVDERGRGFHTQEEPDGWPQYPVPVPESWHTIAPGDGYGARKVRIEQDLLALGERMPTTVLRATAVHGPYCRTPRELYFVKRNLDGRRTRVLAYNGASVFHPASVHNLAELVRLAAARPGSRVLNGADPDRPSVGEIGAMIDELMGVETESVLVDGPPPAPNVGDSPWAVPHSLIVDMSAAERELGYKPVTSYAEALPETVEWLTARLRERDWQDGFPKMVASYTTGIFDYAAEDAWLASRG
ncbi:NAD(P)-dependent oxidoreductase [Streptomyces sp. VRA16 Mangrove soil]|uniref:NAD-dependent epimerase/dehydratase family protein n=1 Tax=Streptomyces sp. VRA16 Mangrove soil TaxID=2817434 RepID=UPI001A9DE222|nr:NAD(P)-dependent oxidoreductase [Streptomyces sp. VRA16 Mangrove soil]MBO1332376.1 NAD(P)-dependent oxidoreductase [Streptomyces sp. VRA16 Mangrove soil]